MLKSFLVLKVLIGLANFDAIGAIEKQFLIKLLIKLKKQIAKMIYFIILFYLYIYPPDSQESDGGANT